MKNIKGRLKDAEDTRDILLKSLVQELNKIDTCKEMMENLEETNGDSIRNMTDKELAEWLFRTTRDDFGNVWNVSDWEEWLKCPSAR